MKELEGIAKIRMNDWMGRQSQTEAYEASAMDRFCEGVFLQMGVLHWMLRCSVRNY
jgi:hypothetical protein